MKTYKTGLFIFRRDLRVEDNTGLLEAASQCAQVITCFIFTPEQVGNSNNYRSKNAIQFMMESLNELAKTIHKMGGELLFFYGENNKILKSFLQNSQIDAVFFNRDYSPYAQFRDLEIDTLCKKMDISCIQTSDYYLYEPGTIVAAGNKPYKKFTPFYEKVLHMPVNKIQKRKPENLAKYYGETPGKISLNDAIERILHSKSNPSKMVMGGRSEALKLLSSGLKTQSHYDNTRDFLINSTTGLSASIKFGCISIREVYYSFLRKFGLKFGLIRELIWREFFAHVLYGFPEVLGKSYQPKFQTIKWRRSNHDFEKWKNGNTGFPVVDAGRRQLNKTGYMHNRGRMIVANFLIKTLLLDWRLGEKYFAQKLTDYDPASNNGNWQGISGTGVDMKPYFRDMNPWIQSAKFDKDALYIKKWVPELEHVDPSDIHKWYDKYNEVKYKSVDYYPPMVNYDEQKLKMLRMYESALH